KLPWVISAVAFAGGWALNILGHSKYEKKAPAFTEDPLSFVAGPVWDIQQIMQRAGGAEKTPAMADHGR
ncbi:MAG TPA: Mpo1-like protein, partial [Candidatus Obscuribacterales bacterium]